MQTVCVAVAVVVVVVDKVVVFDVLKDVEDDVGLLVVDVLLSVDVPDVVIELVAVVVDFVLEIDVVVADLVVVDDVDVLVNEGVAEHVETLKPLEN